MDDAGNFIVGWTSNGQDGDGYGVDGSETTTCADMGDEWILVPGDCNDTVHVDFVPAKRQRVHEADFDLSVLDLYAAFGVGASVHLIPGAQAYDPLSLVRYLEEVRPTIWYSVPTALVHSPLLTDTEHLRDVVLFPLLKPKNVKQDAGTPD